MSETVTPGATPTVPCRHPQPAVGSHLMPHRPRLRFLDGAGDGAAGTGTDVDEQNDDAANSGSDTGDQQNTDTDGTEQLGDAGKRALDAMKAERNAAKAEARAAAAALKEIQDQLALKDKPAEEQALEQARAEARAEAIKTANERILRSELRAAAAGKLADPSDAALFIDLAQFEVDDNGDVDTDALSDAIAELLTRKPHLGVIQKPRFDGDADQGARGKDTATPQWTEADLERHKNDPDAIEKARTEGRLDRLLGLKK